MSIAMSRVDHRSNAGFSNKQKAAIQGEGGGRALLRQRMLDAGEVALASGKRLSREIKAKTQMRYRLRHPDGAYVNMNLSGETAAALNGWIGFAHQLDAVRRQRPDLAEYRTVIVMP